MKAAKIAAKKMFSLVVSSIMQIIYAALESGQNSGQKY